MQKDYTDNWFRKKLNEGFYTGHLMSNGYYITEWDVCDLKSVSAVIDLVEDTQLNQVHEAKDQLINDIKIGFESLLNDMRKMYKQSDDQFKAEYIPASKMDIIIDDSEYEEDDEDYLNSPTKVEVKIEPIEESYLARIIGLDDGDLFFDYFEDDLDNCILVPFKKYVSKDCELEDHVEWDFDVWMDDNSYY